MMEREWYYVEGQERRGPFGQDAMIALARDNSVVPDTLVWTEGMEGWEPASKAFTDYGIDPSMEGSAPPPPPSSAISGPHPDSFGDSIKTVFGKYATFRGRARRPEFWWFVLFVFATSLALTFIDWAVLGMPQTSPLSTIFSLGILIPNLAVTARRLHDIGRSGWWQLILLIPIIGLIVIIYWCVQKGEPGANRFGQP